MEEGDILLGTVEKIEGTTVFVELPDGGIGTLITSEIAPGRIRNLREYVVPHKKIVCKVLRVQGNHIDLSLRRVNSKEKKEVMTKYKQEQTSKSAIRSLLKDKAEKTEEKILKDFDSLFEFLTQAREDEGLLEKYIPKEFQEQIKKITQKKRKDIEVKKILNLKCLEDDGVVRIKKIFNIKETGLKITYISAGRFQLTLKDKDYKSANKKVQAIIEGIEKSAKQNKCEFEVKEK